MEWFHLDCLGLCRAPEGEWISPLCTGFFACIKTINDFYKKVPFEWPFLLETIIETIYKVIILTTAASYVVLILGTLRNEDGKNDDGSCEKYYLILV